MNVMIDLETMGTDPNSAIIAIGAVSFDEHGVYGEDYNVVDLADSVSEGLVINPATVLWWMKQSDEARAEFSSDYAMPLRQALEFFSAFFHRVGGKELWGNGSDFDNVILANAYRTVGKKAPWGFWNNRCYRTMKNVYCDIEMERGGTHHNALDDAKSQATHLIAIAQYHGLTL